MTFSSFLVDDDCFHQLITFANSLDPDQNRQSDSIVKINSEKSQPTTTNV